MTLTSQPTPMQPSFGLPESLQMKHAGHTLLMMRNMRMLGTGRMQQLER